MDDCVVPRIASQVLLGHQATLSNIFYYYADMKGSLGLAQISS